MLTSQNHKWRLSVLKKVAIVSCYFQHNYGSMLQALATQMALDKLGIDNETINIEGFRGEIKKAKIKYFLKASFTSDILLSKLGMVKNVIRKKVIKDDYSNSSKLRAKRFDDFYKNNFRISKKYESLADLSKKCESNYHSVVVGSDQLWLPANIAANYYTLKFVPDNVNSVSYATSFGQSSLPNDSAKKASDFLKRIKHISVREESGQKLVKHFIGKDVPVVCDPTILFSGEEWMCIQKTEPIVKDPYILCYFLGNNPPHREFAKKLKEVSGCKIVALVHLDEFVKSDNDYADITPYDIDPADFLNLIRNASYVCTDSFHCSVFSMLYERQFFTFRRYTRKTKSSTNSRLDTLFKLAGIDNRIFVGNEDVKKIYMENIDFKRANMKLQEAREYGLRYLKESLELDGLHNL